MRVRRLSLVALLISGVALAGCTGGARLRHGRRAASGQSGGEAPRVIRAWSDALRRGQVDRAVSFFAVPSVFENGQGPVVLRTRAQVRALTALPCGAKLLSTRVVGRYTVGRFRLTERPGGSCGSGAGQTASTAFVVRGGKIREWRRVADTSGPRPPPPDPGPPVTAPVV